MAKPREIRTRSVEELQAQVLEAKEELFRLRFQNATHQLSNHAQLRTVRRNVARLLTVLTEKSSELNTAGAEAVDED